MALIAKRPRVLNFSVLMCTLACSALGLGFKEVATGDAQKRRRQRRRTSVLFFPVVLGLLMAALSPPQTTVVVHHFQQGDLLVALLRVSGSVFLVTSVPLFFIDF